MIRLLAVSPGQWIKQVVQRYYPPLAIDQMDHTHFHQVFLIVSFSLGRRGGCDRPGSRGVDEGKPSHCVIFASPRALWASFLLLFSIAGMDLLPFDCCVPVSPY